MFGFLYSFYLYFYAFTLNYMAHDKLRGDTECQNCGHTVAEIYCPHCGQKNTETRQSFHHLVTHFVEDLTHYDSGFWRTIKFLLFRPAYLTKEYLVGKRQLYVPPVKLYIFISFVAFFLPTLIPDLSDKKTEVHHPEEKTEGNLIGINGSISLGEKEFVWLPSFNSTNKGFELNKSFSYNSVREMDSIEALKPDSLRLNTIEHKIAERYIEIFKHNTPKEAGEKFKYAFAHNIPKALFVYLPIFAFWLWLFHNKKRWYFFDHGIFTLHYFSFLLLPFTVLIITAKFSASFRNSNVFNVFAFIIEMGTLFWQIFYFYRAHRKMYGEGFVINFIKSTLLFFINTVAILFVLLLFMILTIYNLH